VEEKYLDRKVLESEDKQATDEEKKDLPKFDSSTGRNKARCKTLVDWRSTAIVANMDDHNWSGEHWVAFYMNTKQERISIAMAYRP